MRKNGSRIISFGRYRATDLLLFAIILTAFDLISFFAFNEWFATDSSRYIFSIAIPVALIVMVRWNWYGMFYAVFDGLLYCILMLATGRMEGLDTLQIFLVYGIGNAFVGLAYLMVKFMGCRRIAAKWYFTALYMVCGWVAVYLGRSAISICFGVSASGAFLSFLSATDLLSLGIGIVSLLVMRKLDGMMERQKDYLLRLDKERRDKLKADTFGDEPVEIDEEALKSLNKKGDDMFGGK